MKSQYEHLTKVNFNPNLSQINHLKSHQMEIFEFAKTLDFQSQQFKNLYFNAVALGLNHLVTKLIYEDHSIIDMRNIEGFTPLTIAAQTANLSLVDKLIDLGADRDALNKYGQGILTYLSEISSPQHPIYSKLNQKKLAKITKKALTYQNVNQQDEDGVSALLIYIKLENVEMVKEFAKYKVNFMQESKTHKGLIPLLILQDKVLKKAQPLVKNIEFINEADPVVLMHKIAMETSAKEYYNYMSKSISNETILDPQNDKVMIIDTMGVLHLNENDNNNA